MIDAFEWADMENDERRSLEAYPDKDETVWADEDIADELGRLEVREEKC